MPQLLIDVPTAKLELRVTHAEEDARIESKLLSAQDLAEAYLGRRIFADQAAKDAAVVQAPLDLAAARIAHDQDLADAQAMTNQEDADLARAAADAVWGEAQRAYTKAVRGIVLNEPVRTAILLTTAHLWENRGNDPALAGLPNAAKEFLGPYRIGLGV